MADNPAHPSDKSSADAVSATSPASDGGASGSPRDADGAASLAAADATDASAGRAATDGDALANAEIEMLASGGAANGATESDPPAPAADAARNDSGVDVSHDGDADGAATADDVDATGEATADGDATPALEGSAETAAAAPVNVAAAMEALLFVSKEPLRPERLATLLGLPSIKPIREAARALGQHYDSSNRAFSLVEIAGGYQLLTRPEHDTYIVRLRRARQEQRLTPHALVTLAIIAYKQPITRSDIDNIRGVGSQHHVRTLLDRALVKVVGRKEAPGAPPLYGTTDDFLQQFGLPSIKDLPAEPDYSSVASGPDDASGETPNLFDRPVWEEDAPPPQAATDEGDAAVGEVAGTTPVEPPGATSSPHAVPTLDPPASEAIPSSPVSTEEGAAEGEGDVPVKRISPQRREVIDPD